MLHAADLKHHGKANMADVFAEMTAWGVHSERSGIKYSSRHLMQNLTGVLDLHDCRKYCEAKPECKAWNFATQGRYCELVDSLSATQEDWRFSSGISQPAYICA